TIRYALPEHISEYCYVPDRRRSWTRDLDARAKPVGPIKPKGAALTWLEGLARRTVDSSRSGRECNCTNRSLEHLEIEKIAGRRPIGRDEADGYCRGAVGVEDVPL
ncbi:MAG: hypothetical protein WAV18_08990, partial [Roseiarcus sp.]